MTGQNACGGQGLGRGLASQGGGFLVVDLHSLMRRWPAVSRLAGWQVRRTGQAGPVEDVADDGPAQADVPVGDSGPGIDGRDERGLLRRVAAQALGDGPGLGLVQGGGGDGRPHPGQREWHQAQCT